MSVTLSSFHDVSCLPQIDLDAIVRVAIDVIRKRQIRIRELIQNEPEESLALISIAGKPILTIDLTAERNTATRLRIGLKKELKRSKRKLLILGEENLNVRKQAIDLTQEHNVVVLMDMIDGTDLLVRNLSNWCSAMVFFDPQAAYGEKILAAFVGMPDDGIYYATKHMQHANKFRFRVEPGEDRTVPLHQGTSGVQSLADASLCFYGQKASRLEGDSEGHRKQQNLFRFLGELGSASRVYNLAGMPMMMKMLDAPRRIDAVFDLHGQRAHDIVAGAYIAQKAGAVLTDLGGNAIDLERSLLRPADDNYRITYILASTKQLNRELRDVLNGLHCI